MKITILCSSETHPVNNAIYQWMEKNESTHNITLARKKNELRSGQILFLISCSEIITAEYRQNFDKTLIIHASDLPKGRGWSPHIWEIANGATQITMSLLEAEDKIDSGPIWKKLKIRLPQHIIHDEINALIFNAEIDLIDFAIENFSSIKPQPQATDLTPSYYPRRTPKDSELDPQKSIATQFDLLRVSDPKRFPAFFKLHGHTYKLFLERVKNE